MGAIVLLFLLGIVRIRTINKDYANPQIMTIENGKSVKINKLSMSATKILIDKPDKGIYKQNLQNESTTITIELNVKNETTETQRFPIYLFYLQSEAWTNGIDRELFFRMNQEETSMEIEVEEGAEQVYKLPYICASNQMSIEKWNHIQYEPFQLVLFQYPQKLVLKLQ